MCSRFLIPEADDTPEELMENFLFAQWLMQKSFPQCTFKRGEICPGDAAAVLAPSKRKVPSCFPMRWGFRTVSPSPAAYEQLALPGIQPPQPKGKLVFNARCETAAQKPLFRKSMASRRCLIPACGYVEWDHRRAPMEKYYFRGQTQILYLAGLYRLTQGGLPEFTILTREAAPAIACFHNRMPVIIPSVYLEKWLLDDSSATDLLSRADEALTWQLAG